MWAQVCERPASRRLLDLFCGWNRGTCATHPTLLQVAFDLTTSTARTRVALCITAIGRDLLRGGVGFGSSMSSPRCRTARCPGCHRRARASRREVRDALGPQRPRGARVDRFTPPGMILTERRSGIPLVASASARTASRSAASCSAICCASQLPANVVLCSDRSIAIVSFMRGTRRHVHALGSPSPPRPAGSRAPLRERIPCAD